MIVKSKNHILTVNKINNIDITEISKWKYYLERILVTRFEKTITPMNLIFKVTLEIISLNRTQSYHRTSQTWRCPISDGTGTLAIQQQKHCAAFASDVNPESYKWLLCNCKSDKVDQKVIKRWMGKISCKDQSERVNTAAEVHCQNGRKPLCTLS